MSPDLPPFPPRDYEEELFLPQVCQVCKDLELTSSYQSESLDQVSKVS